MVSRCGMRFWSDCELLRLPVTPRHQVLFNAQMKSSPKGAYFLLLVEKGVFVAGSLGRRAVFA